MNKHYPTAKEVADEFMRKLKNGEFTMAREPLPTYSQKRNDSKDVGKFLKTDWFPQIITNLK